MATRAQITLITTTARTLAVVTGYKAFNQLADANCSRLFEDDSDYILPPRMLVSASAAEQLAKFVSTTGPMHGQFNIARPGVTFEFRPTKKLGGFVINVSGL